MNTMRWQKAFRVLMAYHTNFKIGQFVGVSSTAVSNWRSGRNEPAGEHKLKLIEVAEDRYPDDMEAETDE